MCRHPRLRMESCVATILDINTFLGDSQIRPEIIRQFERIRSYLKAVSEENVDEADIDRIEEATNQLLCEIASKEEMRGIRYCSVDWIN